MAASVLVSFVREHVLLGSRARELGLGVEDVTVLKDPNA